MNLLIHIHDTISPKVDKYFKYVVYALAFICGVALIPSLIDLVVGFFLGQVDTSLMS